MLLKPHSQHLQKLFSLLLMCIQNSSDATQTESFKTVQVTIKTVMTILILHQKNLLHVFVAVLMPHKPVLTSHEPGVIHTGEIHLQNKIKV